MNVTFILTSQVPHQKRQPIGANKVEEEEEEEALLRQLEMEKERGEEILFF